MKYTYYTQIPTDRLSKQIIEKHIIITDDIEANVPLTDIIELATKHNLKIEDVNVGLVLSDHQSYYGPEFSSIALFYNTLENDEEFEARKVVWQKAKFNELKRADDKLKAEELSILEKREKLQKQINALDNKIIGLNKKRTKE
jgi:vacuolar-type H+-ATPase subunit I/STV1